jgi:uncharacterized protein YjbI with pentapeptide repeats
MANQEHLDILKQGVEAWNKWREEHPDIRPDLSEANHHEAHFHGIDLHGGDLRSCDLHDADLSGSSLNRASLNGAILNGAKLYKANLDEANLHDARLHDADLSEASLRSVDLSEAHLTRTNLNRANLYKSNLNWSHFYRANLSWSRFQRASLLGTGLSESDLSGADLSGANLRMAGFGGVQLLGTIFREADLTGASMGGAIFGDVDLSTVKGLETVEHYRPSIIGIDTIIASQGKIPEIFLRKAGVPPSIIEQIPALVGSLKPIDFYSCFISYSSKDQSFAERLYADLLSKGVRCWFAPEDLKIGDKFWHRIDESIRLYDKLLVVLSEYSVESEWVEREVIAALEKEQQHKKLVLFPIALDEAFKHNIAPWAADLRRQRHIGDFTRWKQHEAYQKAFDRLVRDLKAEAQKMESRDATTNDS